MLSNVKNIQETVEMKEEWQTLIKIEREPPLLKLVRLVIPLESNEHIGG